MKKTIYFILFCQSFSFNGFAAEEGGRGWGAHGEWDLDNPCLYHTSAEPNQKLSYRELLERAKESTGEDKRWAIVDKVVLYFSKPDYDLGVEGYPQLPEEQRLDFDDQDCLDFRLARNELGEVFSKKLNYHMLRLKETGHALREKSQTFNPLVYELDFALNILQVNCRNYIGSLG